jgi:hypothetical protein
MVMGSLIDQQEKRGRATGGSTIRWRQRRVVVGEPFIAILEGFEARRLAGLFDRLAERAPRIGRKQIPQFSSMRTSARFRGLYKPLCRDRAPRQ